MKQLVYLLSLTTFINYSCKQEEKKEAVVDGTNSVAVETAAIPEVDDFADTIDGLPASLYILKNKNNVQTAITNYGARVVSLLVPDKSGKLVDVVVGFKSLKDYKNSTEPYYGATIGRVTNRIAKGKFKVDGKEYSLFTNNGPNTLHGGKKGFQDVVWDAKQLNDTILELRYLSKDMEEGFPGNLNVKVVYTLTGSNGLKVDYEATTDKKTVINLTNHAFFNLNGDGAGSILNHVVQINADQYTPVDSTLIPTGKLESVKGTPLDFTTATPIGKNINVDHQQLKYGRGFDHNYVLNKSNGVAASALGDKSGVFMEVSTEEPGLQFYCGNFMEGKNTFKSGAKDNFRTAFCLETQHFPDAPNQPYFPSVELKPGEVYKTSTTYQFSTK